MLRVALSVLALLVLPLQAASQSWELRTWDDGSFFLGVIRIESAPGFDLRCGERSPQGLSPSVTGNTEPDITPPRTLRLNIASEDIGPPNGYEPTRADVVIIAGTQGYRLPEVRFNELYNTWEADLAADDPVLAAMGATPWIGLQSRAGQRRIIADGFSTAYGQLTNYCQSMFATISQPWNGAGAAPGSMRDAAEAAIATTCNGPAQREDGYLTRANMDGDGQEDVMLNWARVQCLTSLPRPFCGASMCSASVFLSAAFPRTGQPEELLATGVRVVPLSNGNDGVIVGGSLASCARTGRNPCEFLYYWNGVAFVAAP